jgi:hypothetical protein
MKNTIRLITLFTSALFILASCEGPAGPAGNDANANCTECHNPAVVEKKAAEFEFSKHSYGEAAFGEVGNTACDPCHESEGFKYVCQNNVPATFTLNTSTGKYSNDYACSSSTAYGEFNCSTCHRNLHTSYTADDFFPLTTTAAVSMTMWKGTKSIDLTTDGSRSNLCVKCHQPRPLTTSTTLSTGDVVDYASLASSPNSLFYDSSVGNASPNTLLPSYRMHIHYGASGAIFAGKGGVEFTGLAYTNSAHTTVASCQDCHMADMTLSAGGHTFRVRSGDGPLTSTTTWNYNGCNATGCHSADPINSTTTTFWTTPRAEIKTLLTTLATKINSLGGTTDLLHKDATSTNLWAGITANNYDGYLDIYDPSTNPLGAWKNPGSTSSWTTAQKATNNALPVFPSLKNVVVGSMINFQLCLREYSMGIHNHNYSKALLQNSVDALTAAGI